MKVTYLGPAGATFSEMAYMKLAAAFGAPLALTRAKLVLARSNEEVIPLVITHGGYGVLAMETRAQGRIDPTVNSFIELLGLYKENCPLRVLAAIRMKLHFALMARDCVSINQITKIIAHPKAIGACKGNIAKLGIEVIESSSNGKAAEEVACNAELENAAALAPIGAAHKYNLIPLCEAFEDAEAITTFFLLGPPRAKTCVSGETHRALLLFRVKHTPGALVKTLSVFEEAKVNLTYIHSFYTGNGEYDFAVETECPQKELRVHAKAMETARKETSASLLFGPFPVLTG